MIAYHPLYVHCAQCGTYGKQPDPMERAPNTLADPPPKWTRIESCREPVDGRSLFYAALCPDCGGKLWASLKFTEQKS